MGVVILSLPMVLRSARFAPPLESLLLYARWPSVAAMFWLSLLVIYRHGPCRAQARWSWVSCGAMIATALWLCGSFILASFVAGARTYQLAYGSVGTVVLVLAWFLLSAFAVLVGAEFNAELEGRPHRGTG
jgi:membrane protein